MPLILQVIFSLLPMFLAEILFFSTNFDALLIFLTYKLYVWRHQLLDTKLYKLFEINQWSTNLFLSTEGLDTPSISKYSF